MYLIDNANEDNVVSYYNNGEVVTWRSGKNGSSTWGIHQEWTENHIEYAWLKYRTSWSVMVLAKPKQYICKVVRSVSVSSFITPSSNSKWSLSYDFNIMVSMSDHACTTM